jgi:predicted nucleic acid-binding protein
MLVVADTSALVALAACDALSLLDHLFQEVRVPLAVFRECTVPGKPEAERLDTYLQAKVIEIDLQDFVITVAGLGRGELEAMALYKHLHADRLLMDDRRARKMARLNNIEVIGSLGVLLRAKEAGMIPEIRPLVIAIQAAGVHFGERLVDEALHLAGERGVPS